MAKTIIIKTMAFNEVNSIYDNTPSPAQFNSMFNQCIAKINADANINLPMMYDKSGDRPDGSGDVPEIPQEDWDELIDFNGIYTPLDDNWVRRLIIPFIGYRTEWIEEGANAAESGAAYGDFMNGLREFKNLLPSIIDAKYNSITGQVSDQSDPASGNIETMDLNASPFSGGI